MTEERKGGVVFKNGAKVNESQPDWLGKVTVDGKAYSVALWEKESQRTGVPFMSLSFRADWDDDDIEPSLREFYRIGESLLQLGNWVAEAHSDRDPSGSLTGVLASLNKAHEELSVIAPSI